MRFWECRWKSSSRHGTTGHEIAFSEAKSRTAEGEIHFAAFRLPAPRSAAWVKSQLSSTQSDQYPRRATRFPGRLERLLTCATDNSRYRPEIIPGVRCRYLRPSVHRGARPNGCGGRCD